MIDSEDRENIEHGAKQAWRKIHESDLRRRIAEEGVGFLLDLFADLGLRAERAERDRDKLAAVVRQADEFLCADEFLTGPVAYGLVRQDKGSIRHAFREALAGLDPAPTEEEVDHG